MILRTSGPSPFGRKVVMAAHILGLVDQIKIVPADTNDPADTLRIRHHVVAATRGDRLRLAVDQRHDLRCCRRQFLVAAEFGFLLGFQAGQQLAPLGCAGAPLPACAGAGLAFGDELVRRLEFGLVEELAVADRPVDGLVEHLGVGQQGGELGIRGGELAGGRIERGPQRGGSGGELRARVGGNGDAGRRQALGGRWWSLGSQARGEQDGEEGGRAFFERRPPRFLGR